MVKMVASATMSRDDWQADAAAEHAKPGEAKPVDAGKDCP